MLKFQQRWKKGNDLRRSNKVKLNNYGDRFFWRLSEHLWHKIGLTCHWISENKLFPIQTTHNVNEFITIIILHRFRSTQV